VNALLQEVLRHGDVVVQCHDVPDADAIASGFALSRFIESRGCKARFVYGGPRPITKPNLTRMVRKLEVPLEHVRELPRPRMLVTVDCQYGGGNLARFEADDFAVIDHHRPGIPEGANVLIRPALGSCSTLVWDLLRDAGFDFASAMPVNTALYYGLFTDTNQLSELRHPLDRDLAELSPVDWATVKEMRNSTLTAGELGIVSDALASAFTVGDVGVLKAKPCDPNILGFASDIAQQVDGFAACVVYCHVNAGLKLSVRSSVREVMASELAAFLAGEAGSGGGGMEKAGAFMACSDIGKVAPGVAPDDYLLERIRRYNGHFDHIYCGACDVDFNRAPVYRKLRNVQGFAKTADVFPEGAPICVRTLEGDIDTVASKDVYLMIGVAGEVYPIGRGRFERDYEALASAYASVAEYPPSVIDRRDGERKALLPHVRACVPRREKLIRAIELGRDAKVFSDWDRERYFLGRAGDYIAASDFDPGDIFVVNRAIFEKTYAPAAGR
jgi:phosphoglycolate phosphatase